MTIPAMTPRTIASTGTGGGQSKLVSFFEYFRSTHYIKKTKTSVKISCKLI